MSDEPVFLVKMMSNSTPPPTTLFFQYPVLEELSLDENWLDESVFLVLGRLRKLKRLNLDKNRIAAVPTMKMERGSCVRTEADRVAGGGGGGVALGAEEGKSLFGCEKVASARAAR